MKHAFGFIDLQWRRETSRLRQEDLGRQKGA
jgi:hypothetical protein